MTARIKFLLLLTLSLFSCKEKEQDQDFDMNSTQSSLERTNQIITESEIVNDYTNSAALFAKEILKENFKEHIFKMNGFTSPKHMEMFINDGLENIRTYSNKRYSKKSPSKYYEQYILFVATYRNQEKAQFVYNRMKTDSKYGLGEERELSKHIARRVSSLNIGAKPGGLIAQKGIQIFSLVETCRETPIGGSWIEYEQKFINYLTEAGEEIEVLNANCGSFKYRIEKRIAS